MIQSLELKVHQKKVHKDMGNINDLTALKVVFERLYVPYCH